MSEEVKETPVEEEASKQTEASVSEHAPVQGSLLGKAQIDQESVDLDLDVDLEQLEGFSELGTELEEEKDENEDKEELEFSSDPFTPELSIQDENIDFGDNPSFEQKQHQEGDGHSIPASLLAQQAAHPSDVPEAMMAQGASESTGTGYHDVLGIGSLGTAIFGNLPSFKKSPEQIREKAAENYQKQQQKLDQLIFNAKNRGADISVSHVGKVQQGYLDQDVAPPTEAMQSAYAMDKDCQKSWTAMQKELDKIEELSTQMQKTSAQAGFDSEETAEEINAKISEFHEELSGNLEGITDEKGNKFTDRIAESTKRIQEILKKILESLASFVGMNGEKGQSQVSQ